MPEKSTKSVRGVNDWLMGLNTRTDAAAAATGPSVVVVWVCDVTVVFVTVVVVVLVMVVAVCVERVEEVDEVIVAVVGVHELQSNGQWPRSSGPLMELVHRVSVAGQSSGSSTSPLHTAVVVVDAVEVSAAVTVESQLPHNTLQVDLTAAP